eukprot:4039375-Karenia_brevis.AAC.1
MDADLANCYGTPGNMLSSMRTWKQMRAAVADDLPELSSWLSWSQQPRGDVVLPGRGSRFCDRGAEQGEPTASAATGVLLGSASRRANAACNPSDPMQATS